MEPYPERQYFPEQPIQRPQKTKREYPPSKLPAGTIMLMLGTTVFLDATQWLLDWVGVGIIINPILDWTIIPLGFYIWFKTKGISLGGARKSITFLGGALFDGLEASAIPLWTLDIGLVILFQRAEEFVINHADQIESGSKMLKLAGRISGKKAISDAANTVEDATQKIQRIGYTKDGTRFRNSEGTTNSSG